jgi:dihydrofolate reductase
MTDEEGFADRMNAIAKYVVTSTLDGLTWNNSTPLEGDVAKAVGALKERVEGSILVAGSASLVHELAHHGLVDEYRLVVYPVSLGAGKRVFGDGTHTTLELTYEQGTSSGAVLLAYRVPSEQ